MTNKELGHRPVLIEEVIEQLGPKDNETYIDATFGYGGYTAVSYTHLTLPTR